MNHQKMFLKSILYMNFYYTLYNNQNLLRRLGSNYDKKYKSQVENCTLFQYLKLTFGRFSLRNNNLSAIVGSRQFLEFVMISPAVLNKFSHSTQHAELDLNKRSCSGPKTIMA